MLFVEQFPVMLFVEQFLAIYAFVEQLYAMLFEEPFPVMPFVEQFPCSV
jgi:hypothetical protein